MNQRLTLHDLKTSLRKLKTKESPGPDVITNKMLIHLGHSSMENSLRFTTTTGIKGNFRKYGERQ